MSDQSELNPAPMPESDATGDADDEGDGGGLRLHVSLEEKVEIARQVADRMFSLLGAQMPTIDCRVEDEQVVVRLTELDASLAQAGDTRVLESLQFILNKAINRFALKRTRLSIDAEGFRRRRPEGLDKVAAALALKVMQLGKPIAIGPIGQGDLRFLSAQLARSAGVVVQSFGTPDKRRLVIQPLGSSPGPGQAGAAPDAAQDFEPAPAAAARPSATAQDSEGEGEGGERRGRRRRRR